MARILKVLGFPQDTLGYFGFHSGGPTVTAGVDGASGSISMSDSSVQVGLVIPDLRLLVPGSVTLTSPFKYIFKVEPAWDTAPTSDTWIFRAGGDSGDNVGLLWKADNGNVEIWTDGGSFLQGTFTTPFTDAVKSQISVWYEELASGDGEVVIDGVSKTWTGALMNTSAGGDAVFRGGGTGWTAGDSIEFSEIVIADQVTNNSDLDKAYDVHAYVCGASPTTQGDTLTSGSWANTNAPYSEGSEATYDDGAPDKGYVEFDGTGGEAGPAASGATPTTTYIAGTWDIFTKRGNGSSSGAVHDFLYGNDGDTTSNIPNIAVPITTGFLGYFATSESTSVMPSSSENAAAGMEQGSAREMDIAALGFSLAVAVVTAQTIEPGLASETDTAFVVTPERTHTVGLATTTDTAFIVDPERTYIVGLASEIDTAFRLALNVGLAFETDTAFIVTPERIYAIGLATETDTGFIVTPERIYATGLATETDTAFIVVPERTYVIGLASETDTALALTTGQIIEAGLATTTDTAFSCQPENFKRYYVGVSDDWDDADWAFTDGGPADAPIPSILTDVYLNAGSGAITATIAAAAFCKDLICTGFTGTLAGASALEIAGSQILVAGMTLSYTGTVLFSSTGSETVTSGGKVWGGNVTFDGVAGVWALQDNFSNGTNSITLTNGTLSAGTSNVITDRFASGNTNTRVINMGTGSIWTLTGSGTVWDTNPNNNLTINRETSTVDCTYSGALARVWDYDRDVGSESDRWMGNFKVSAGTGNWTFPTGALLQGIDFTGFSGTLLAGGSVIFDGDVTLGAGMIWNSDASIYALGSNADLPNQTIIWTSNGVVIGNYVQAGPAGTNANPTFELGDAITFIAARGFVHAEGVFDTKGFSVTGQFYNAQYSGRTPHLIAGATLFSLSDNGVGISAWEVSITGWSGDLGTSTIRYTNAGSGIVAFRGHAETYWNFENATGGTAAVEFEDADTFNSIDIAQANTARTVYVSPGNTIAFKEIKNTQPTGHKLTSAGEAATHTLDDSSGINKLTDTTISWSIATGGARFEAFTDNGNVDGGNNTGWLFSIPIPTETDTAFAVIAVRSRTIVVGLSSETDTAFVVIPDRAYTVGLATETDTGFIVTPVLEGGQIIEVGLASETDTAFTVVPDRAYTIGLASETDTALRLALIVGLASEVDTAFLVQPLRTYIVGLATETSTAFIVTPKRTYIVGLAQETDTAFSITADRAYTIGLANETDTGFIVTYFKTLHIGLATEIDTAFRLGLIVGLALETDTAFVVDHAFTVQPLLANETDTAFIVVPERTYTIGLASEIDTGFIVVPLRTYAVGLASETDTAFIVDYFKTVQVELATETDTGFSVSPERTYIVGLATETDTAFRLGLILGIALETDTAFTVIPSNAIQIGLAQEIDTAFAVTPERIHTIGLASETNTAFTVVANRAYIVGLAQETDTAFALTVDRTHTIGLAIETDIALRLGVIVELAIETDTAFSVDHAFTVQPLLANELDTAFAIQPLRLYIVGLALETDTAFVVTPIRTYIIGLASETDTAFVVAFTSAIIVGLAIETDTAFAVQPERTYTVGLASETDTAFITRPERTYTVGLANETDTAFVVTPLRVYPIGLAQETDSAFTVVSVRVTGIGLAQETDTAFSVTPNKTRTISLGLALETDTAFNVIPLQGAPEVGLAIETDTAFPVSVLGGVFAQPLHGIARAPNRRFFVNPKRDRFTTTIPNKPFVVKTSNRIRST